MDANKDRAVQAAFDGKEILDWRCAGCGAPSPGAARSCDCATEVVIMQAENGRTITAWKTGEEKFQEWSEFQRDNLYRELRRAQGIIDKLKAYRESLVTCPFESTPQVRARIVQLAHPPRDDFDRAVIMLLDDFNRLLGRVIEAHDYERAPENQPENMR